MNMTMYLSRICSGKIFGHLNAPGEPFNFFVSRYLIETYSFFSLVVF
jgi:hypothetical protein